MELGYFIFLVQVYDQEMLKTYQEIQISSLLSAQHNLNQLSSTEK